MTKHFLTDGLPLQFDTALLNQFPNEKNSESAWERYSSFFFKDIFTPFTKLVEKGRAGPFYNDAIIAKY